MARWFGPKGAPVIAAQMEFPLPAAPILPNRTAIKEESYEDHG